MLKHRLLTAIAEQLISSEPEPCPADPSCPYSDPGWCAAPDAEKEAKQQKALAAMEEKHLFAYIDEDSPFLWPCDDIRIGLGMSLEEALNELEYDKKGGDEFV